MYLRAVRRLCQPQRLASLMQRLQRFHCGKQIGYATAVWRLHGATGVSKGSHFPVSSLQARHLGAAAEMKSTESTSHNDSLESTWVRLEAFYRLNGFLGLEQIQPVLELMESPSESMSLSEDQGLFLLKVCGNEMPAARPEKRMEFFERIWHHLRQKGGLKKEHYETMLQTLQNNRAPLEDYQALVAEYMKLGGERSTIFSKILAVAGSNGNVKQATELLNEMRSSHLALTESDFDSLLLGHGRAHDLDGCRMVYESMQAAGVLPSTETQSTLLVAYVENDKEQLATEILQEHHGQFEAKQVIKMLRSCVASSTITSDFVARLVQEFHGDFICGPEVPLPLRYICIQLLNNGQLDRVNTIIDTLPAPSFQENQDVDTFGVFLLHALFQANYEIPQIIEIATHLEDSGKNSRALHIATELVLRRNPPMAVQFFEALVQRGQPLRAHYFWPLLMYNFRRHGEGGILRTLHTMKDLKVECDQQTLVQFVLPRLSMILIDARMALQQLDDAGVKTSVMLTPIISHMIQQHKWLEVATVVNTYPTKFDIHELIAPLCSVVVHVRATKRFYQFAKMVAALSAKSDDGKRDFVGQLLVEVLSTQTRVRNDLRSLQRLLGDLQKCGLHISAAANETLQSLLEKNDSTANTAALHTLNQLLVSMTQRSLSLSTASEGSTDSQGSSTFIKHPRDMNLDELECHLIELESKQMNTRGVLRRLLQLCVRDNHLQRALEIKAKCDGLKVEVSPGMLASIFELYTKLKDLPNARRSLERLQKTYPGFQIDEHKFVDYAALLVHCGQLEGAKKLLQQRSASHRIIGGDYILKNVWNLLTNVAHLAAESSVLPAERNLTRETFAFIQKLGYCRSHNAILGPIVRERLLRGDIQAAVAEFKQLAEQYKHTPLQFELLSLLVRLSNADAEMHTRYNCNAEQAQQLLAEVTETISSVHGTVNMNSGLVLAFAESGTDNQLRRLLISPDFRINEELMLRNCEHLGQEGAVQTLLRLARGARGLNRSIDEQNIYKMLLNNFIRSNDCSAALNLYDRLETDDELKISQDFMNSLVNLLRSNNVEIPSNVALRAHVI